MCVCFTIFRGEVSKSEVQWSPIHDNKFITWGPDIRLYEIIDTVNSKSSKNLNSLKGLVFVYYINIINIFVIEYLKIIFQCLRVL